jgi:hypothetical protein
MYLYGYWNSFNLDVFEYIGLGDLITHATYAFIPLLLVVLFFILVYLFLLSFSVPVRTILLVILLVVFFIIRPLFSMSFNATSIVVLLILLVIPVGKTTVDNWKTSYYLKTLVAVFLMVVIPFYAHDIGVDNASKAKRGDGALFVDLSKSTLQLPIDQHHLISYLGRLGDFFALYEMFSDRLIMVRTDKVEGLVLVPLQEAFSVANRIPRESRHSDETQYSIRAK